MSFVNSWLIPRVAFWVLWTAWLAALQFFLLDRIPFPALPLVVGVPLVLTWAGSRWAQNQLESPKELFWKGAAACFLLAWFASLTIMKPGFDGMPWCVGGCLVCVVMVFRSSGSKRLLLTQGDLFLAVHGIARQMGATVRRITVFRSPRNTPSAFAMRTGGILISDSLLKLLSRRETDVVIAHEVGHLCQIRRPEAMVMPLLAAGGVLVHAFWPEMMVSAWAWPLAGLLLWRGMRRRNEYDADARAIAATRDAEGLITALTRVARGAEIPLEWGFLAGMFMPHPPLMARFRAIARRGGMAVGRVEELIAAAGSPAAEAGYASPFEEVAQAAAVDSEILAKHRVRTQNVLICLSGLLPVLIGVAAAFSATFLFPQPDRFSPLLLVAEWLVVGAGLHYVAYELLVGMERHVLRRQLTDSGNGYYTGLALAAEPRTYDSVYHYDMGFAEVRGDALLFTGTRCSFTLKSRQARRVWLADGPRHWTPRKVVCVAYEGPDGEGVVSLQSMERWYWPGTAQAAEELLRVVTEWSRADERSEDPGVAPPRVAGAPVGVVSMGAAVRSMRIPCMISMCAGCLAQNIGKFHLVWLVQPFLAPVVTAGMILFALAPHLARRAGVPAAIANREARSL